MDKAPVGLPEGEADNFLFGYDANTHSFLNIFFTNFGYESNIYMRAVIKYQFNLN